MSSNQYKNTNNGKFFFPNLLTRIKSDPYLFGIPLLTVLTRLVIFIFIPFTYEDAYITFRYAENFASGFGLVYNTGEYVYGTTTPLFAIVLSVFYYFGISCFISSLIVNLIAEAIVSSIVYKLLKEFAPHTISAIISLLYVFSPSNISWSIQGMETAFFSALIALSFFLLFRRDYFYALLVAFVCAMVRIDGLSVVAIISVFTVWEKRLSSIKLFILPLTIFSLWLLFLYLYFGSFLPNSMIAKLVLYSGHNPSIIPGLKLVLSKFFMVGYFTSSILTVLFVIGVIVAIKKDNRFLPMVLWFTIYYCALIFSKTVIHGWYLIPPLFVFIIISGIGINFVFQKIIQIYRITKKISTSTLLLMIFLFSMLMLFMKINQVWNEYQYEQTVRIPIGLFLKNNSPESATVFLEPIGIIGYFSERYIYDDAALVSPVFLELNKIRYDAKQQYMKIDLVKPDYLVLRDRDLEEFYSNTRINDEYESVKNFVNGTNQPENLSLSMTVFKRIR